MWQVTCAHVRASTIPVLLVYHTGANGTVYSDSNVPILYFSCRVFTLLVSYLSAGEESRYCIGHGTDGRLSGALVVLWTLPDLSFFTFFFHSGVQVG